MSAAAPGQVVELVEGTAVERRVRCRVEVHGVVQGVGFRPFVYALAAELGLSGWVRNDASGVVAEVEGGAQAVDSFATRVWDDAPPLAVVEGIDVSDREPEGEDGFTIDASVPGEKVRTLASPDIATCHDCAAELVDPGDRRHRHPFITCTNCGPRFTVITGLPYDRAATTMTDFAMCAACASEYADPRDRRFHAQTIACLDCGPRLELVAPGRPAQTGDAALAAARQLLAHGGIVAVKGLGGYHLACDASDPVAVGELRRRKRRGGKPFAVMVRDLATARELAVVDDVAAHLLTGIRRPVVVMPRRTPAPGTIPAAVCDAVAPGNPDLGVLLPYTPLHRLLMGLDADVPGPSALVMTSGNLGGEPIVTDDTDALQRLAQLADAWLRHDRPIQLPCDDSVTRVVDGDEMPIRRSRGYAPMPLALPFEVAPILAAGADLKNTCCVAEDRYAWLSQHVGDMDDVATIDALSTTCTQLETLTTVDAGQVVADAHPAYRSTTWARQRAAGRPLRTVQHHHAHIAAVMGEHGLDGSSPVLGIAFDGTGYGPDGAIWGGEVLLADYKGYRRLAHLGYVPLAGGDLSVRRPYRMALAHLRAAGIDWDDDLPPVTACPHDERAVLAHQLDTGFGCVPTSSMGRLFDAIASLAGVRHVVDYEAEAAIELEGLARGVDADGSAYRFGLDPVSAAPPHDTAELAVIDTAPVVRAVVDDVRGGVAPAVVADRFHRAVVELVGEVADRTRDVHGPLPVVLGGGVFQNAVLLAGARARLHSDGHDVLWPRRLPPNDGGLALGQILIGASC